MMTGMTTALDVDVLVRDILDRAVVGIVLADLDGAVVYTNEAFRSGFELVVPDGRQAHVDDVVHRDDGLARTELARVAAGEVDRYQGEHVCNRPGGATAPATLTACVVGGRMLLQLSAHGRRGGTPITGESRWQFALDAARQGVWDYDHRDGTWYYSPTCYTMRGIPLDEYGDDTQEAWLGRVHPADRERVEADLQRQNRGEAGFDTIEYRERHRDGHYMWILSRGKPVEWDEHGNVVRTIGTDTDITHLKQVEARLAAEKERWRVTLEAIADATICIDAAGRITFMNAAAQEWTGWFFDEAASRPLEEVVRLERTGTSALTAMIERCLATGVTQRSDSDAVLVSRDGQPRDVSCSASAIQPAGGGWTGAVLVFQDMTRSRLLQAQLEHAATHDSLTGLANRASFSQSLEHAAGSEDQYSLVFIDLDHFKQINDTFGHAAGDGVLRQVAEAIRSHVRGRDVCARLGGDEFVLLLHGCGADQAERLADRIGRAIADLDVGEGAGAVGASLGLTALLPGEPPDAALIRADTACYRAKTSGRGQVCRID